MSALFRQCVLLVGGRGTRLGELVSETPKPMLPIGGKPFLVHLIWQISKFGFSKFLLLAGYKADVIQEYFPRRIVTPLGDISITVHVERDPLGTGGALRGAGDFLDQEFLLCNGDTLCLFDMRPMVRPFRSVASLARLALLPTESTSRYGKVLVNKNMVQEFTEKPALTRCGLMSMGVYYMRRELLEHIPLGKISLEKDIFPGLARGGCLEAHICHSDFFIDIGIPQDLEKAEAVIPTLSALS